MTDYNLLKINPSNLRQQPSIVGLKKVVTCDNADIQEISKLPYNNFFDLSGSMDKDFDFYYKSILLTSPRIHLILKKNVSYYIYRNFYLWDSFANREFHYFLPCLKFHVWQLDIDTTNSNYTFYPPEKNKLPKAFFLKENQEICLVITHDLLTEFGSEEYIPYSLKVGGLNNK